jgi:23S rRNA pseudouridine955/2504/2580 synthase
MLAKKRSALTALHADIRSGQLDKRYIFLAHGSFKEGFGHVPLRYPLHKYLLPNGERRVKVADFGQESYTIIKFLGNSPKVIVFSGRRSCGLAELTKFVYICNTMVIQL